MTEEEICASLRKLQERIDEIEQRKFNEIDVVWKKIDDIRSEIGELRMRINNILSSKEF